MKANISPKGGRGAEIQLDLPIMMDSKESSPKMEILVRFQFMIPV